MPKCPNKLCDRGVVGDYTCMICGGRGWLPFWSDAERVGLKAMGYIIRAFRISGEEIDPYCQGHIDSIKDFVHFARRVKEGK